jgi:hypothetical protein
LSKRPSAAFASRVSHAWGSPVAIVFRSWRDSGEWACSKASRALIRFLVRFRKNLYVFSSGWALILIEATTAHEDGHHGSHRARRSVALPALSP